MVVPNVPCCYNQYISETEKGNRNNSEHLTEYKKRFIVYNVS